MKRKRRPTVAEEYRRTHTKTLCVECNRFFDQSNDCMDLACWNICIDCVKKDSRRLQELLRSRGITLPYSD